MPKPFHPLGLNDFRQLLSSFPFTRALDSVHLHHTWRPDHSQYRGLASIEGMWAYHTQGQGWSDIAQHLTIAPDGVLWTGRSWNRPPASASGFNGNDRLGPFMIEVIGDFDRGRDSLDGAQRAAVIAVIAAVQERFKLAPGSLRFHCSMSGKTCPGSSLNYDELLAEVTEQRERLPAGSARDADRSDSPFPQQQSPALWSAIQTLNQRGPGGNDEGEVCEHDSEQDREFSRTVAATTREGGGEGELSPEVLHGLRPYVINLNQGLFSSSGRYSSSQGDVDAIFDQHLPHWAKGQDEDKALRIVIYAHGGLVSEQQGLLVAQGQIDWWLDNGVYPLHFVWETGLWETLGQVLQPEKRRAIDWAAPSDVLIETLARGLGGVKIWSAMKASAEKASATQGGARYAARKLARLCQLDEFKDRIQLHAVGHSAGSIFHAHFLPAALAEGVPALHSLSFLAPAVRVDTFAQQLLPLIGQEGPIRRFSLFTMARDFELSDSCLGLYRKSLLYLIYYALEAERKTPILGLEEALRRDQELKSLLGLDGSRNPSAEVIWSKTRATSGASASAALSHGDFDNDRLTMESVAQRILGGPSSAFPAAPVTRGLGVLESLEAQEPALAALLDSTPPGGPRSAGPGVANRQGSAAGLPSAGGRKLALCVGIDRYRSAPLAACVNDARLWSRSLQGLGFTKPILLLDDQASRAAILDTLRGLIDEARAGDVIVFQFSGHGTQVADLDGDEAGGDTPDRDEALCPCDYDQGRFIIDDDLAALFNTIPGGVNVTVFSDCCHSGSNTRLAIGAPPGTAVGGAVRRRFLAPTPEMEAAHLAFRNSLVKNRDAGARTPYEEAREVLFAACRSNEVALESQGHGHFTRRAVHLLEEGLRGMSNTAFVARVIEAMGREAGQHPELHCAEALRLRPFLGAAPRAEAPPRPQMETPGAEDWRAELAAVLEKAALALRQG